MKAKDMIDLAMAATTITQSEFTALRKLVEDEAFSSFGGSREQEEEFDGGDYGGWFPPVDNRRFGAYAKAYAKNKVDWEAAASRLVSAPAYSDAVKRYGKEKVLRRIEKWWESPSAVEESERRAVVCREEAAKMEEERQAAEKREASRDKSRDAITDVFGGEYSKVD